MLITAIVEMNLDCRCLMLSINSQPSPGWIPALSKLTREQFPLARHGHTNRTQAERRSHPWGMVRSKV